MNQLFEPFINTADNRRRFVSSPMADIGLEEAMGDPEDAQSTVIKRESQAFRWFFIVASLVVFVLISRSAFLQILQSQAFEQLAAGNRNRLIPELATRGIIYDRFGNALVKNQPSFDAVVVPVDLPRNSSERSANFNRVSGMLHLTPQVFQEIEEKIHKKDKNNSDLQYSFQPLLLKESISRDEALLLQAEASSLPGVRVEQTGTRHYPQNDLLSHVLGYVGKITAEEQTQVASEGKDYLFNDSIGKSGIEKSYEDILRGQYGEQQVEVDSRGNITKTLATAKPQPGKNVVLSIDVELQKHLHDALAAEAAKVHVSQAAAVAMDPRNGEVLALVSLPTYDNNLFANGISQEVYSQLSNDTSQPLYNKAIAGLYPPGSTFKPFVAATALEASVITPQTTINDTGKITVGGRTFYDYNHAGVGITDLNKAIALSINSYFYTIGGGYGNFQGLGIDRLMAGVSKFGLSNATGIDLPGERKGTLPTPAWKQRVIGEPWYIGDTYNSSIGQGNVLATPLAMATAYSAIANGGTLYHPHLLRGVIAANETKMEPYKPQVIQDHIFPESVLAEIRTAMRTTVTSGSGRSLNSIPAEIAGKTGSAQFIIPHSGGQQGVHAWFGAFAPYNDAKIVLMILLPGAGEGHQVAVPVAKDVLQWYFTRGEVQNKLPVK